jgi:hypothetical protein
MAQDKDIINKSDFRVEGKINIKSKDNPDNCLDPKDEDEPKNVKDISKPYKSLFDILQYLVNDWLRSSYFLELYNLYIDREKDGIDKYSVDFKLIREDKSINKFNKIANFLIYKTRRLLLLFVKTFCFALDISIRLFVSAVMLVVVASSLLVILSTLGIVDKQIIGCNFKVLKCV